MAQSTDLQTQTGGKTFCQIVGRDIAAPICLETQGHEGCFGCATPTRLCELCRKRPVDVSAVGMCSPCLVGQLHKEATSPKPAIGPLTRVDCQLLKRRISAQMCGATQGQEGCRNCSALTRLCEACKQRPMRFKEYGLCLACSVEEYGAGWKPSAEVASPQPEASAPLKPQRRLEDLIVVAVLDQKRFPSEGVDGHETSAAVTPSASESATVRTQTINLSGRDYRVTVRMRPPKGGERPVPAQQPVEQNPEAEFEKLVQRGKDIVVKHRRASIGLLQLKMGLDWSRAKEVINQLEKDGIVGPNRPKTSRQVLILPRDEKPTAKKPGRKGGKPEELAEKAKLLILEHRNATYEFLQQKLGTGALTTKRILDILERQGVVSPGTRGQPRRILIEGGGSSASTTPRTRRAKTSIEVKVACLDELAVFFGPRSSASRTLREVIADLGELQRIKGALRRLGQE